MKILITGGDGYIAKKLFHSLSTEHQVTTITRADFDLTDKSACFAYFRDNYFDVILHTAVVGGSRLKVESSGVRKDNLKMYYNLVTSIRPQHTRFISFGSGAELGDPTDFYGRSKREIAKSMLSRPNCFNIRIYAVFDHDELDTRFIKSNITRYVNKEDMIVHQDKCMDFFYMDDLIQVVKFYIKEADPPKEFNCNYLDSKSLSEIAEMINNLDDYRVGINILQKGFSSDYLGPTWDTWRIRNLVGLKLGIENVYNTLKLKWYA